MKSTILVMAVWTSLLFSSAASALSCGDTVTTDIILTEDLLDCPDVGLHILYTNGITINLNGYSILGAPGSSASILMVGSKGSRITNGDISGFTTGIAANH